jgi:glycosyltransferase involved in cell wall biosynthesis
MIQPRDLQLVDRKVRTESLYPQRSLLSWKDMLKILPRILFVHNYRSRFVEVDLTLLQGRYDVTECCLPSLWVNAAEIWKQVASHDLILGWFASWHSFLPLLFSKVQHKPSVLIIGGYDIASIPEIRYGHQRGGLRRLISRRAMGLASCLLTNACYSRQEAEQNANIPRERIHVVYHAVDDFFGALPSGIRARMALTVGIVKQSNLHRKGHEQFVRTAALVPDVEFVMMGEWQDGAINHLRSIATPNVTFTGWVDDDTLMKYYRSASVYVQASRHEGFGLTVAEAMLAGCIPIVTTAGALPEVVGDCGVYVSSDEPTALAQAVKHALTFSYGARERARARILSEFSIRQRAGRFYELIDDLLLNSSSKFSSDITDKAHK